MAREVQLVLLPREGGRRGCLEVAFRYSPMLLVGGDLFDVVATADGNTAFFISDVWREVRHSLLRQP
jgi:serine phosphatase RsbU (regulator of sigma subunit)